MTRSLQFLSSTQYTEVAALPDSPKVGQTAFMNGILYIYASLNGVTTWFPLNQPQSFYVHSQGLPATRWEIHHNLGSRDAIIATYDMDNRMIDGGVQHLQDTETGEWYIVVTFTVPVLGYAVVFGRENLSAPSMDAEVINVTDGIYVGGEPVAVQSDIGELILELNKKTNVTDVQDNVTSIDPTVPLSANQGRVLKELIDNINTLLTSNDVTLDELQEVVDFIKLNRATLDALTVGSIGGLQAALDTLSADIANETTRASAAEATLQGNIDSEAASRAAVDGNLAQLSTVIKSNLVSAINEVVDSLNSTTTTLQNNITAEANTRTTAIGEVNTALSSEESARIAADGTLQDAIDTEADTRAAADNALQTAVNAKLDATLYTAADVLTKLKTVDGAGSGLDADLLDGQSGAYYLDWNNATNKPDPVITLDGDLTGSVTLTDLGSGTLTATVKDDSHNHTIANVDGLQSALNGKLGTTATAADSAKLGGLIATDYVTETELATVLDAIAAEFEAMGQTT